MTPRMKWGVASASRLPVVLRRESKQPGIGTKERGLPQALNGAT